MNVYHSFAQGFAACYGTTRPIIFEMEPDFYQYTYTGSTGQTQPWTYAQAGQIMGQFVGAMKPTLPNALFSMDISPWVGTNNNTGSNGSDNGANWYSNFDMTQFTFVNTSGGSTNASGGADPRQRHDLGGRQPRHRQADPRRHRLRLQRQLRRSRSRVGFADQHQRAHARRRDLDQPVQPGQQLGHDHRRGPGTAGAPIVCP